MYIRKDKLSFVLLKTFINRSTKKWKFSLRFLRFKFLGLTDLIANY